MVFTKYLFTTIAGLTGGINTWVFTSSGGAVVNQELERLNSQFDSNSVKGDELIEKESERLSSEEKQSESKFNELNNKNEDTKKKSRNRREAGNSMQSESYKLETERDKQARTLNLKKTEFESDLNNSFSQLKNQIQENIKKAHEDVKKVVEQENKKLEEALSALAASNQALIKTVRECIENMPYEIFVEKPEQGKCSPSALERVKRQKA